MSDGESVGSAGDIDHDHDVGEKFEASHKGRWKITNRMVDVDTGEVLYRLRSLDPGFNDTEILTDGQMKRIYDEDRSVDADTDRSNRGDAE